MTEYLYTDDIRSELEADAYVELLMLGEQYNLPRLKGKPLPPRPPTLSPRSACV
jgi:hypothetical protein